MPGTRSTAPAPPVYGTPEIMGCGDSLIARSMNTARPGWQQSYSILFWAQHASMGDLRFTGIAGLGGQLASQIRSNMVPVVLGATRRPKYCLVIAGVNDLWINGSYWSDPAAAYTAIEGIANDLLAAGITPVLATIPGFMAGGGVSGYAHVTHVMQLNSFIRRLASLLGVPLADFFEVCSDPAIDPTSSVPGTWKANYLANSASDQVHPGGIACRAMGEHLAAVLRPQTATPAGRPMYNLDGVNKLTNGLNTTDAGADGIPDGWTVSAAGTGVTHSLVTDAAIRGKWWRIVKTVADGTDYYQSVPVAIGQMARFSGRLKINSLTTGIVKLSCVNNLGTGLNHPNTVPQSAGQIAASQPATLSASLWLERDVATGGDLVADDGTFVLEGVQPAGSSVLFHIYASGNCDVQFAELSVEIFDANGRPV